MLRIWKAESTKIICVFSAGLVILSVYHICQVRVFLLSSCIAIMLRIQQYTVNRNRSVQRNPEYLCSSCIAEQHVHYLKQTRFHILEKMQDRHILDKAILLDMCELSSHQLRKTNHKKITRGLKRQKHTRFINCHLRRHKNLRWPGEGSVRSNFGLAYLLNMAVAYKQCRSFITFYAFIYSQHS